MLQFGILQLRTSGEDREECQVRHRISRAFWSQTRMAGNYNKLFDPRRVCLCFFFLTQLLRLWVNRSWSALFSNGIFSL